MLSKILTVFFLFVFISVGYQNDMQINNDITSAINKEDFSLLNKYFKGFVSLSINNKSDFLEAQPAKERLKAFLKKHPSIKFSIDKSGVTGDNYFIIGRFKKGKDFWSAYFLFSPDVNGLFIQQIEIQKELF